jgi:hypothetical protein
MTRFEMIDTSGTAPAVFAAVTPTDTRDLRTIPEAYPSTLALRCPPWACWTAIDADGQVWAYAQRPQLLVLDRCWAPFHPNARIALVDRIGPCLDWRTSLLRLPEPVEHGERFAAFAVCGVIVAFVALTVAGSLLGWWL